MAVEGKLDPVIGRDEEIRRLLQILSRRKKNNPVLVGEPGTGKTATPEQANSMHTLIRNEIKTLAGTEVAKKIQSLYGGSVNVENTRTLLSMSEIDGALVGGASLKTDDFSQIVKAAN